MLRLPISSFDWDKYSISLILNSNRPAYTTAPNLINPELTWETSNTYDVGIDMGLLNNRLQFTYDYYRRLTLID